MGRTLLALHAHPDDESSKTAATVARYVDLGVRCILVTATGGEEGDILNPAMDRPGVRERLTELRTEELEEAAAIIGYHQVIMLGYRDSGMPESPSNDHPEAFVNAPFDEALARVVEVVRRERPQVMIGYDDHRRYPHPDHIRVHHLSVAAFEAAAHPDRFPDRGPPWEAAKLYAPAFARSRIEKLHTAMEERGLESPLAEWLERWEDDAEPEVVARIPILETLKRGRKALLAHRTQVDPEGFWFRVPEELINQVYPYEDFVLLASRVAVDPPEEDLFAGL